MQKHFMKVAAVISLSFLVFFFGCSNVLSNSENNSVEYGSISISSSRALDVSALTSATVTVSGWGMNDITKTSVAIHDGVGSFQIDNIPVGKNRIVTVESNVDCALIRAIVDVEAGKTSSVQVTWATTALGNVFYYLNEKGTDISKISDVSAIETAIQAVGDVHPVLVDAEKIAADYPSLKDSSNYRKATGTVSVTAADLAGYKVQITDPASEVKDVASASDTLSFDVVEGNYSILVLDSSNAKVAEKAIVVGEGVETKVSAKFGEIDFSDKTIVFVKANSAPTIWAWETSGDKVSLSSALGQTWNTQPKMAAATTDYMTDPTDWYMADFSSVSSGGNIKFKINSGNQEITGLAGTFWYDGSSCSATNPSPVTGAVTFTVVNPAIVTKPTVTISPASGEVSSTGKITVTLTDGNGTISAALVKAGSKSYSYSDFTNNVLTINVSDVASAGNFTVTASATNEKGTANASASLTAVEKAGVKIYVSATDGAPTIWAWTASIKNITNGAAYPGEQMANATGLKCNDNWYVITTKLEDSNSEEIKIILNGNSQDISTGKTSTFWYDAAGIGGTLEAKKFYDSDPSIKPDPVKPTLKISPASGKEIGTVSSIKIEAGFGYDEITENSVTINGKSFTLSEGTNSYPVSDFATTEGVTITVSAVLTNSKGTATVSATYTTKLLKEDPFTWDNVNAYFVLTDRFYNGDTTNDHSYSRKNGLSGDENVATFHGGDLAGLTQKLDYFDKLGVNAIWITAPYEQVHGWVSGKDQKFPHYAFHGYYTLDWSSMDQNMGTVEELRTFVNACHSKGIRVIMDIVMNHVGYNNTQDMVTFEHGYTEHTDGWFAKALNPQTGNVEWYANDTVKWDNSYWESWFGPWIRSFGYATGSEYGGSCGGLPDVKTELTESVGIAPVHDKKWNSVDTAEYKASYYNPSVAATDWLSTNGNYRTDMNVAPADYQVAWLSAWVREVGIDGFRCDTAKHVEPFRWGQLKDACTAALEAWRNDSSKSKLYNGKDTGAADWDEAFWMTGECFGWTAIGGSGGAYYGTGKFDSMINFSYNGSQGGGTSSAYPSSSDWNTYLSINKAKNDDDNNGNLNNVLTYLSSHDTKLCRPADAFEQGTMFTLLPGGIQIYYGDESSRPQDYLGCGDTDMMTRGDMNWDEIEGSKKAQVAHWGKVGNFRKYNPAVGAGVGSGTKRTYSGAAGENKVAIGIDGTSVDVSGLFADGTTVYNWYDGTSAKVSGGKVTFAGGTTSQPILVSEKNPATYGITY